MSELGLSNFVALVRAMWKGRIHVINPKYVINHMHTFSKNLPIYEEMTLNEEKVYWLYSKDH